MKATRPPTTERPTDGKAQLDCAAKNERIRTPVDEAIRYEVIDVIR
jgi:hypothetical protein